MKDIELLRKAEAALLMLSTMRMDIELADQLRALADRMEKAEPVAYFLYDESDGLYKQARKKFKNDPDVIPLFTHPSSDEVIAVQVECGKLKDEVERLKAENDAYRRTLSATVEERNRAEAKLSAIREDVARIKYLVIADAAPSMVCNLCEAILNTINQPQEEK